MSSDNKNKNLVTLPQILLRDKDSKKAAQKSSDFGKNAHCYKAPISKKVPRNKT